MRWHLKRTKLLFALIPIISIVFYVVTANNSLYANQSFVAFDIYQQICDTAKPQTGKDSPEDYSASENFAIAADVYRNADCAQSTTVGTVTAMGFYKQSVQNYRSKANGELFNESLSLSAIASVAEQRYFKNGALLYRKGNTSGDKVKDWEESVTELSSALYRQRYGVVPQDVTKYAVTTESVVSGELVSANADGTYTYKLILDAAEAQKFARYEMMTYAGVSSFPEFKKCELTFTIDKDWKMLSIESFDVYKIALMGGTECQSHLTETFSYEEIPLSQRAYESISMPQRAKIFIDYVPTGNSGNISQEKGPADYLNEAFGEYISGLKPLCLQAQATIAGETLNVQGVIDIGANDFRFRIGENIFAVYKENTLYLALGDNKYTLPMQDVSALTAALGLDLGEIELDTSILGTLFENHTITETDTHIHILMPFTLQSVKFDVDMGLKKTDDTVTADTIDATVTVKDISVTANVQVVESVELPAFNQTEYVSLSPALAAVRNTLGLPAYRIDGALSVTDKNGKPTDVLFENVRIVKPTDGNTENISAEGTVTVFGIRIDVKYLNGVLYAKAGNLAVKADTADLGELLSAIAPLLPADMQLDTNNTAAMLENLLPDLLPGEFNVETALGLLTALSYENNTFSLAVTSATGNTWSVAIEHDDLLRSLRLQNLSIAGMKINAQLRLQTGETTPVTATGDYIDAKDLCSFLPNLKSLLDAQSYTLGLNDCLLSMKNNAGETTAVRLSGNVILNRNPLSLSATVVFGDTEANVVFADKTVYLTAGNFSAKCTMDTLTALLQQLGIALPQSAGDIQTLLAQTGISLPATNVADLLDTVSLAYENGVLTARMTLEENSGVALTLQQAQAGGLNTGISYSSAAFDVTANLHIKGEPHAQPIEPNPNVSYFDLGSLIPFVKPILQTAKSKTFRIVPEVTITTNGLQEVITPTIDVQLLEKGFALAGSVRISDVAVDFMYRNGNVYLHTGNIAVSVAPERLPELLESLKPLLGDVAPFVQKLSDVLGADKTDKIVATLHSLQTLFGNLSFGEGMTAQDILPLLSFALPTLDFEHITSLFAGLTVSDDTLTLPVQTANGGKYTISVSVNNETVTGATLKGLTIGDYTVDANVALTCNTGFDIDAIDTSDIEYLNLCTVENFLPPLRSLLAADAFRLEITEGALDTSIIKGTLTGNVEVALLPLTVQAQLTYRGIHEIFLRYTHADKRIYLAINNIKLTATTDNLKDLFAMLGAQTGKQINETGETASLINSLLGGASLKEILSAIDELKAENNGIRVGLHAKDFSASLSLLPAGDRFAVNVNSFSYGTEIYETSYFRAVLSPAAGLTAVVFDPDSFVDMNDLRSYIQPVRNTLAKDYYDLSFGGTVLEGENGSVTTIATGSCLRFQPTGNFADVYAKIVLAFGSTGETHTIEAYIFAGTREDRSDITAYLNYDGFYAKIGYGAAMGIVGALCDILNLDIPMLDNLLGDRTELDTTVFETMDIQGLNELRDTINALFATAEDVTGTATGSGGLAGLLGMIDNAMIDKLLSGVALTLTDAHNADGAITKTLCVQIDNAIFANDTNTENAPAEKSIATIKIGHNGEFLSYADIGNLVANGDTVNFNATLDCADLETDANGNKPKMISAPDWANTAFDFSTVDKLLYAFMNTAAGREFRISGAIKLNLRLFGKDVELVPIPLSVSVKILGDGSTVAAVKLEVPYFNFVAKLTPTHSYMYFANNMLYFSVDVFERKIFQGDVYQRTETKTATVEEFMQNPMDYLFFLVRINMEQTIRDAMSKDPSGTPSKDPKQILTKYEYSAETGDYNLTLNLKALAGNNDLGDLNLSVGTKDNYVSSLHIDTVFVSLVSLSVDASVTNYKTENGVITGMTPCSEIDFGQSATLPKDLTKKIDTLEDDLARIFPTEAAITFAQKATEKADKAQAATKQLQQAAQERKTAEERLTSTQNEYNALLAQLSVLNPGSFGYERTKAQCEYAAIMLARAHKNLAQAKAEEIDAAADALTAAEFATLYANRAANAAQALNGNTAEDIVAAASAAREAATKAHNAAQAAQRQTEEIIAVALETATADARNATAAREKAQADYNTAQAAWDALQGTADKDALLAAQNALTQAQEAFDRACENEVWANERLQAATEVFQRIPDSPVA